MVNFLFPQKKHQEKPPEENLTKLMEFVPLDFVEVPCLQMFLFGLFLIIYVIILMRNGTIFLLTKLDPALFTPMYVFLGNFFLFGNLLCISYTTQNAHVSLGSKKSNFLDACAAQTCWILMLGATKCFLLVMMAYDRYMAFCNPLNYPLVMNYKACVQLVAGSWISGIPVQIEQTFQIFSLPFCASNSSTTSSVTSPQYSRWPVGTPL